MATTFDTLKGGVENLLRRWAFRRSRSSRKSDAKKSRPLEVHDIAQIKSLLPRLITFAYIDSELLRVHSAGAGEASSRRAGKAKQLDDAYELAGSNDAPQVKAKNDVVLLFSFNDGELKSSNGAGKVKNRKFA